MKVNDPPIVAFHFVQLSIQIHSSVKHLHVLGDRRVANCVGCSRDGGLAAVAAATAVQAGHVDPVQVVVVLPPAVAQRLILTVLIVPASVTQHNQTTTRGTPCPIAQITKEDRSATWSLHVYSQSH